MLHGEGICFFCTPAMRLARSGSCSVGVNAPATRPSRARFSSEEGGNAPATRFSQPFFCSKGGNAPTTCHCQRFWEMSECDAVLTPPVEVRAPRVVGFILLVPRRCLLLGLAKLFVP